jgi:hypothetical protein
VRGFGESHADLCIYCGKEPAAPGEDLIPRALGRFPMQGVRKRVLCKRDDARGVEGCNERLTKPLYRTLFEHGMYGLFRATLPSKPGRPRKSRGPYRRPGYPLVEIDVPALAYPLLGFVEPPARLFPADQVVLRAADGTYRTWPVPGWATTPEDVTEEARDLTADGDRVERFYAVPGTPAWSALGALYPGQGMDPDALGLAGKSLTCRSQRATTADESRAIALLAFHLFLAFHGRAYVIRGNEPEFETIRATIGGERDPFEIVLVGKDDTDPWPVEDPYPDRTKHLYVCGAARNGDLVAGLCPYFRFPGSVTPWWHVLIARGVHPSIAVAPFALIAFGEPRVVDGQARDGCITQIVPNGDGLRIEPHCDLEGPGNSSLAE